MRRLKTWTWGVGVEYENRGWFEAEDGKPETTRLAYFRLYDTTVAALEDALGAENVTLGAHSMSVQAAPGILGPARFHRALRQWRESQAERAKGRTSTSWRFILHADARLRSGPVPGLHCERSEKAMQAGLTNLKYGVDEGRVLDGPDRKVLFAREVEHPIQAAGDAKLFHLMVDHDVDYFSTWGVTTDELFGDVPIAGANLRNLAFRMNGSALLTSQRSGRPADAADDVSGLAGYDAATKTLRVLLYNFNRNPDAAADEDIAISVAHVRPARADAVTLRSWPLDGDHGNWWKAWQADVAARKMPPEAFRHHDLDAQSSARVEQPGRRRVLEIARARVREDGSIALGR